MTTSPHQFPLFAGVQTAISPTVDTSAAMSACASRESCMSFRIACATTVAAVVLLALPVAAAAPVEPSALPADLPSTLLDDADMRPVAGAPTRLLLEKSDLQLQSLALVGPVAIILILTALGVTITFRSWHEDVRRQRDQFRQWRHGASAHAGKA
jgi:hypothetical protein